MSQYRLKIYPPLLRTVWQHELGDVDVQFASNEHCFIDKVHLVIEVHVESETDGEGGWIGGGGGKRIN